MRLAIMQPYFFPYIGYFQLMNTVDKWVVFDDIQFIDKGWINRNRILHPDKNKGWQFITIPLNKRRHLDKILEITIANNINWKDEIFGKLTFYKKKAPYYSDTLNFIEDCLTFDSSNLSECLIKILRKTAIKLEINTEILIQSNLKIDYGDIEHAGQWSLKISKHLDANEYINPHSGYTIFNQEEFNNENIKLSFIKPNLFRYCQRSGEFISGLSIIDVLMWNDLEKIREMIVNDFSMHTFDEIEKS